MPILDKPKRKISPARIISISFALIVAAGTLLLMLPFSARSGQVTPFADALFTATSATCVTGLAVVDTYQNWTLFGQMVILLLIQIGGLGLVTFVTFFNLAIGRKLGLRSMQTATESIGFSGFGEAKGLIQHIILMSLLLEGIGAAILATEFVPDFGREGIFIAIFTAISAFCNAGFDIFGREDEFMSLMNYADNPLVLCVIMVLIIGGGVGFLVWYDLTHYRKTRRITLHTRIVLLMFLVLIVFGAIIIWILEYSNMNTLGDMPAWQQGLNALFQSVTTRTAGFNTVDIDSLNGMTKLFMSGLMFIGAAPGSTGGGIKVTTIAVIVMTVFSVIKNREDTQILGRRVTKAVVYRSLVILTLSGGAVLTTFSILYFSSGATGEIAGIDSLFEAVSAFATVGLSTGVTGVSSLTARLMLILTMFIGRIGPVSLAFSITFQRAEESRKNQVIPEGRIIVG